MWALLVGIKKPLQINAPWSAGLTWLAAGDKLGGNYYEDYYEKDGKYYGHINADLYALDFNYSDSKGNTDAGSLILAVADGFLMEAAFDDVSTYGNTIVISHGIFGEYCYASRYAHLEEMFVPKRKWVYDEIEEEMTQRMWDEDNKSWVVLNEEGGNVIWLPQGTPLGRAGNTGVGPGNHHLHFAMYKRPKDECLFWEPSHRKFDLKMAVKPEPMNGVIPIDKNEEIESTNYSVGYEEFNNDQIFRSGTKLPEQHEIISTTYESYGGEQGLFGKSVSPVNRITGTDVFYQSFILSHIYADGSLEKFPVGIVENDNKGFVIFGPMWSEFNKNDASMISIGMPISNTYKWTQGANEGYRTDFRNASLVWSGTPSDDEVEIINAKNGAWEGLLWQEPNNFFGVAHQRRDEKINYSWQDSSNVGPFRTENGFSAKWTTINEELVSGRKVYIEYQGHVKITMNGEVKEPSGDSPDKVSRIENTIDSGTNEIEIWYWQGGKKPGQIRVDIFNTFLEPVYADSDLISSEALQPIPLEYVQFLPPVKELEEELPIVSERNVVPEFEGRIYDELGKRFIKEGSSWQSVNSGYEQHHWVSQGGNQNSGKWLLNPPSPGNWEVYVFIPESATSQNGVYTLFHNGKNETIALDQSSYKNLWVNLGTYDFIGQGDEYLILENESEITGNTSPLVYDAVGIKWIGKDNTDAEGLPVCPGSVNLLLIAIALVSTFQKKDILMRRKTS